MQYYFFFLTSSISYKLYVFLSNEIRISLQRCLLGKPLPALAEGCSKQADARQFAGKKNDGPMHVICIGPSELYAGTCPPRAGAFLILYYAAGRRSEE